MSQLVAKRGNRIITSTAIGLISLALAYVPLPGVNQTIVIVSGSELVEPLKKIEAKFEEEYPHINLELKSQGSQDIVNKYIDNKNDFKPTVMIPASAEILEELNTRWRSQNQEEAFYQTPQPITKTLLVGIAWPERGEILFSNGSFSWQQIEEAMSAGFWPNIGGQNEWGSFDFVMTDPQRSNSGQLTLNLWVKSEGIDLNHPDTIALFETIKKSVYLLPRSTDILLQEFITRGPNDADVAMVYESIALSRWQQSAVTQNKPYRIYYLNPTIETVATAGIVTREVSKSEAEAGQKFIEFLRQPEQQKIFIEYGFRPVTNNVDLTSVSNSPWNQNIPGVEINPSITVIPAPEKEEINEIQRLWQRVD